VFKSKRIIHVVVLGLVLVLIYTVVSSVIIQRYAAYIITPDEFSQSKDGNVAIVFGGGVQENTPLPLVRERLDAAHRLLESGAVTKIIVSGDNRFLNYNEPTVMKNYLIDTYSVDTEVIQEDFAGRSTYETCERANKVFGVTAAYLVSESVHLPRALYLCRHFDIDAYGYASDASAASGLQLGQRWREILARDKAVFNVTILGEQTILGNPIAL
jgi:SanA protein